jgi:ribonuclease E
MANTTHVAAGAAKLTEADLERVREFARESILLEGETIDDLEPGTARRRAVDSALKELDDGAEVPSFEWRRNYSLLLGLERLLWHDNPKLTDGTDLSEHQVDALSGTLAALTAELERSNVADPGNGRGRGNSQRSAEAGAVQDAENGGGDGAAELEEDVLAPDEEEPLDWEAEEEGEKVAEAPEDPGASRRFWFEHATGAGKTVAAGGFVDASRTGGVLILTHRRNLVDQFIGEISTRGDKDRLSPPLLDGADHPYGPVTVETYQWFVRNAGRVSDAYSIVICDEAHTALGEKTSACIRDWPGPVFIGMTATGALIARHVADLFPTQTSRFDLAQAARRGVIAPLRCIRIPPGPGVRTIAKVPLRRGEVDQDFDQEELAKLLDQEPFNVAVADLYRSRFRRIPGVVYTAGVRHAKHVAKAFQDVGINARAVSGETPKRELTEILAAFERGEVDVLCNAMLLAEGWNSPRATICMHLAPTASRRVYQQRVGRVTRRNPGKESGLVIDFVHPATTHDETIVTLHSLLDRDVYRGGAIVVGPVRRGRGRRVRVERRVVPVSSDPERRLAVLERELWRIAVENLNYSEQHAWAALAGARVTPNNWRRAKAMIQHDQAKELRRRFLLTCLQRNRSSQLRLKALAEIAGLREAEAFDDAVDVVSSATSAGPARASCCRRSPSGGSAAETRRRRGSGGWPRSHASCTRSTRCNGGRRPNACWGCSSTPRAGRTAATPGASFTPRASRTVALPSPCSRQPSRTRPRPRRSCAEHACGWPASPRLWLASCCATSPRAEASAGGASVGATDPRAPATARPRRTRTPSHASGSASRTPRTQARTKPKRTRPHNARPRSTSIAASWTAAVAEPRPSRAPDARRPRAPRAGCRARRFRLRVRRRLPRPPTK